jgi:hypothetical protein
MKQVLSMNYAMVLASVDAFELNHPSTIFTNDNVEVITGATADEVDAKLVTATATFPVLPSVGQLVQKDRLYSFEGKIYKCIQEHYRMNYSPAETLALFNVYRKETADMQWIAGEKVAVGTKRIYNSKTYECIQAHVTQSDWTPPAVPALWKEVVVIPTTGEWAVGVAYKVGDEVMYLGKKYRCRQAHTSIATWNPVAAASLWLLI